MPTWNESYLVHHPDVDVLYKTSEMFMKMIFPHIHANVAYYSMVFDDFFWINRKLSELSNSKNDCKLSKNPYYIETKYTNKKQTSNKQNKTKSYKMNNKIIQQPNKKY